MIVSRGTNLKFWFPIVLGRVFVVVLADEQAVEELGPEPQCRAPGTRR
jgi:hypothetical protein